MRNSTSMARYHIGLSKLSALPLGGMRKPIMFKTCPDAVLHEVHSCEFDSYERDIYNNE